MKGESQYIGYYCGNDTFLFSLMKHQKTVQLHKITSQNPQIDRCLTKLQTLAFNVASEDIKINNQLWL